MHVTLFLCGDVMTGRGIDQILAHPSGPELRESYVRDAGGYVELAEEQSGPLPRGVGPEYVWGAALDEIERVPDFRIVNLETSITRSEEYWPGKGIHYRMHPANVPCLRRARIDACVLANNHVLDFGYSGLVETLEVLEKAEIKTAGAGRDVVEARRPAVLEPRAGGGRVLVFAVAHESSGVYPAWAAGIDRPGLDLLPDLSLDTAEWIAERVRSEKRRGDVVVLSIHWGENWGYEIPPEQVAFAHRVIDGGVDVVHGHSSHHPRPIEVYRGRLVLYGCGDFLNDYEGIGGHEEFRGDLSLMYFATVDGDSGALAKLEMRALQMRRFRLQRAGVADVRWMRDTLDAVCTGLGSRVELEDETLVLAPVPTGAFRTPGTVRS